MKYVCFWCECVLELHECTKDHLVSKPLHSFLGGKKKCANKQFRSWHVTSCYDCNHERGAISNLLRDLVKLRRKLANNKATNKQINTFYSRRCRLLPAIISYKTKIEKKVEQDKLPVLLRELEELV